MVDQWYFEIGDGHVYGPYSMEKLQRWAAAGNLMPTHRVRNAESSEWLIAAYVPGLEQTMAAQMPASDADEAETKKSLGKRILGLGRKGKAKADGEADGDGKHVSTEPPDIVALCDEIMETAFERNASDIHIDPRSEEHT